MSNRTHTAPGRERFSFLSSEITVDEKKNKKEKERRRRRGGRKEDAKIARRITASQTPLFSLFRQTHNSKATTAVFKCFYERKRLRLRNTSSYPLCVWKEKWRRERYINVWMWMRKKTISLWWRGSHYESWYLRREKSCLGTKQNETREWGKREIRCNRNEEIVIVLWHRHSDDDGIK